LFSTFEDTTIGFWSRNQVPVAMACQTLLPYETSRARGVRIFPGFVPGLSSNYVPERLIVNSLGWPEPSLSRVIFIWSPLNVPLYRILIELPPASKVVENEI
jgi:hypothetical protein